MTHPYTAVLESRFGGILTHGEHEPDGAACALEAVAVARGIEWTDDPATVGLPDLRPLNDARWPDDATRTAHMVPVVLALWGWQDWSPERQQAWAERVVLRTVREVIPIALRAAGIDATACEQATDLAAAAGAAQAAAGAAEAAARAAWDAAGAAQAAAWAAEAAARAAQAAAGDAWAAARAAAWAAAGDAAGAEPLTLACHIWASEAMA